MAERLSLGCIGLKSSLGFNNKDGLSVELKAIGPTKSDVITRKLQIYRALNPQEENTEPKGPRKGKDAMLLIGIFTVIIFVLLALSMHKNSENRTPKNNSLTELPRDSSSMIGDSSIMMADSVTIYADAEAPSTTDYNYETQTNESTSSEVVNSQWKGNQLKNGSSPFSSCFGNDGRGGYSWILFKNRNNVDAVVCLINSLGGTIRNEYIQAGAEFEMSNVPIGTYYIKVLYGNDWNPNLSSPCGSEGFFESDVSFSASDGYNDIINVETSENGASVRYSTHTITLYPVVDGNMSQRGIDASQFFRQ